MVNLEFADEQVDATAPKGTAFSTCFERKTTMLTPFSMDGPPKEMAISS
jgi:hypothetical protein